MYIQTYLSRNHNRVSCTKLLNKRDKNIYYMNKCDGLNETILI